STPRALLPAGVLRRSAKELRSDRPSSCVSWARLRVCRFWSSEKPFSVRTRLIFSERTDSVQLSRSVHASSISAACPLVRFRPCERSDLFQSWHHSWKEFAPERSENFPHDRAKSQGQFPPRSISAWAVQLRFDLPLRREVPGSKR